MRKFLLLTMFIACALAAHAQLSTPGGTVSPVTNSTNNVGIGLTNPTVKLDIKLGGVADKLRISRFSASGRSEIAFASETGAELWRFGMIAPGNSDAFYFYNQPNGATIMTLMNTGNVGIGTADPKEFSGGARRTLHLANTAGDVLMRYQGTAVNMEQGTSEASGLGYTIVRTNHHYIINTNGTERFRILNTGNVGIGTTAPTEKLTVNGTIEGIQPYNTTANFLRFKPSQFNAKTPFDIVYLGAQGITGAMNIAFRIGYPYSNGVHNGNRLDIIKVLNGTTILGTDETNAPFANANLGNVAIGTTDARGHKLAVAGKIIAEEVIVELKSAWPDYVFEAAYDLQPLDEVADFVQKNKHLPGVPSAVEVAENGVQLGDMSVILLKKIEELTLYILEQEKKMAEQDKRIAELEKNNKKK